MSKRLRVNPILCEAHGVCAELLPELISLDPWGYPILAPGPVPPGLEPLARRTAASCPALALLLEPAPPAPRGDARLTIVTIPSHQSGRPAGISADAQRRGMASASTGTARAGLRQRPVARITSGS